MSRWAATLAWPVGPWGQDQMPSSGGETGGLETKWMYAVWGTIQISLD